MLVNDLIIIKKNNFTLEYYNSLGYDVQKEFEIDIKDLPKNSTIRIDVMCDVCNNQKSIQYRDYLNSINNGGYYACCAKCAVAKKENTSLEIYGFSHPSKSEIVKSKQANTNIEIYQFKTPLLNPDIQLKIVDTLKLKYNVTHFSRSEFFHPLRKPNINSSFKNPDVRQKALMTRKLNLAETIVKINKTKNLKTLNKWNNILTNHQILNYDGSIFTIKDLRDDKIFEMRPNHFYNRIKFNIDLSFPIGSNISYYEVQLHDILDSLNIEYTYSVRTLLDSRKEIDIYIPSHNIAIEFNGVYWHSIKFKDKYYHYNKRKDLADKNILLVDIWEDEWVDCDHIKSRIISLLNTENVISVLEPVLTTKMGYKCWT